MNSQRPTLNALVPIVTIEECGEVIQAISKVIRFGLEQRHPETGLTNKEALELEMGQLMYMMHRLERAYNLNAVRMFESYQEKALMYNHWETFSIQPEPKVEA